MIIKIENSSFRFATICCDNIIMGIFSSERDGMTVAGRLADRGRLVACSWMNKNEIIDRLCEDFNKYSSVEQRLINQFLFGHLSNRCYSAGKRRVRVTDSI